jgi:GT2 family glycosyltransferase
MQELLVSVIMNVRDGAPWLREAVDSVLAQTFADWELIAWDDRSTDESASILSTYDDKRIHYFLSPEDTTLGRARELAVERARGEWLAFLDQDDVWVPDKLEKQSALVRTDTACRIGMVYGRTVAFTSSGAQRDFDLAHEFALLPEGDIFIELFRKSCFIAMSSVMIRRRAFHEIGGIPSEFQLISDYHLFVGIARRYEARAVQDVVCHYRLHADSLSHRRQHAVHSEALLLVDHWAPFLDPRLASWRRRMHSHTMALEEMRLRGNRIQGVRRLLTQASAAYMLSRPFAQAFRATRRMLGTPYWMRAASAPPPPKTSPAPAGLCEAVDFPLRLSVIVVNWNVKPLLRECLRSVYREMRLRPELWELIVVDNHSSDGSAEMVSREFSEAILLANSDNLGFARANNQAFRICRGRYVLLLNPDTAVLDHGLDEMMAIMESRREVAALGCRLLNTDGSVQRWTGGSPPGLLNIACHYFFAHRVLPGFLLPPPLFLEAEPASNAEVGWVSGACMLLRRGAIGERLFDERFFMYGEDLELCQRLIQAGWKVLYTPGVQILHCGGRSLELQTAEVQMSRLRGLRQAFAMHRRSAACRTFDLLLALAFLLRSIAFWLAALVRPGRGFEARAVGSRQLLATSFRALVGDWARFREG